MSRNPKVIGAGGGGHTSKHTGTKKHRHASRKHNPGHHKKGPWQGGTSGPPVVVVSRTVHHAKPRGWSPGVDVDCCAAQAVGVLLGLSDAEVLDLYWATASTADEGASIEDTLDAVRGWAVPHLAAEGSGRRAGPGLILGVTLPAPHAIAVTPDGTWWSWGEPFSPAEWPGLIIEETWSLCP